MAGHDGGLDQRFVLEVTDIPYARPGATTLSDEPEHRQPLFTTLSNKPQFRLPTLEPDREYQALVYAENAKGRSDPPVVLPNIKLQAPPADVPQESGEFSWDGFSLLGPQKYAKPPRPVCLHLGLLLLAYDC